MNILVTGAGGDIGSQLTSVLVKQGHHVRALVSSAKEADRIRRPGVEIFTGDITDPASISGAALDIDIAYHLAAALFVIDPENDLRRINYEGTINVAEECMKRRVKRLIFPSFPLVLGPHRSPSKPINPEDATGETTSFHALYKKLCEQHLLILDKQGKLPVTILRLGTVYGPDMRFIKTLKKYILKGWYRIPGSGNNLASFVHIEDVIQAMLLVLTNERAAGKIYNVADDLPVRFKDFVFEFARLLGVDKPRHAPIWLYHELAAAATFFARLTKTAPLINNDIVAFSISSFAADASRTKDELGFSPRYPTIYDGLPTCVGETGERRSQVAA